MFPFKLHSANMLSILITFEVSNLSPKENPFGKIQSQNIASILITLEVSKSTNLKPSGSALPRNI